MAKYSKEFKKAIIAQMMPPNAKSVSQIHAETGISTPTLYNWRRQAVAGGQPVVGTTSSADAWNDETKLAIVIDTATLNEHELSVYCRERGLYVEQVDEWRAAAVSGQSKNHLSQKEREEFTTLKKRNRELEKELRRKEKALAEAAALLVLRKKAQAIWGDHEDV